MPNRVHYDVIVVGAGPAGATLAHQLAKEGVKVLILEKARLPRYKTCGGGINIRAAKLLDFDISPVIERVVYGAHITYKLTQGFTKSYPEPLTYMVMRDKFDYLLTEKAREAGSTVLDRQQVRGIEIADDGVTVTTDNRSFSTAFLAGADGANSVVARSLGLTGDLGFGVAIEAEVSVNGEAARWDLKVGLDFGVIPGGYMWIFPKEGNLSIGAIAPIGMVKRLKPSYTKLMESLELSQCQIKRFSGHKLPLRRFNAPVQRHRALLVGDAAGLVDPLTGDGIYGAIKSAKLAAPVIIEGLKSNMASLEDYQRSVDREIMPELQAATALHKLFTRAPRLFFYLGRESQSGWSLGCRVLRGEITYVDVQKKLLPLKPLFQLASRDLNSLCKTR